MGLFSRKIHEEAKNKIQNSAQALNEDDLNSVGGGLDANSMSSAAGKAYLSVDKNGDIFYTKDKVLAAESYKNGIAPPPGSFNKADAEKALKAPDGIYYPE